MGRELATFADLQKSLAELGLTSGTALLRLSFRPTAQPLEEAMGEIERYFCSAAGSSASGGGGGGASGVHAGSVGTVESVPDAGNADAMMPLDDAGGSGEGAKSPALASPAAEEAADPMAASASAPVYTEGGSAAGVDELEVPEETIVGPDNRPISIFAPPSNATPQATKRE
jgi:tether containing UBX domain for GLUT4